MEIHRCRFLKSKLHAVKAIAVKDKNIMALGKENGSIELWDLRCESGHPEFMKLIPGFRGASIEGMAWITKRNSCRLFTTGLNATLIEWDVENRRPKVVMDTFGPAWCMAVSKNKREIAVGCEAGNIRLYNIHKGAFDYKQSVNVSGGRIMSIAYGPNDSSLIIGNAQSSILVYSLTEKSTIHRLSLSSRKNRESIAWTVHYLSKDNVIVSGDSNGHLCFWDFETGTIIQKENYRRRDILCLAVSDCEQFIYSSGIDKHISCHQRTFDIQNNDENKPQWRKVYNRMPHLNDVLALATYGTKCFSAGIDNRLVTIEPYEAQKSQETHFSLMTSKRESPLVGVSSSKSKRLVCTGYEDHVSIWEMGDSEKAHELQSMTTETFLPVKSAPICLLDIDIQSDLHVLSCAMSENSKFVAISDVDSTKLFMIKVQGKKSKAVKLKEFKIGDDTTSFVLPGCTQLHFTRDSTKLIAATIEGTIFVIDMCDFQNGYFKTLHRIATLSKKSLGPNAHYIKPDLIANIAISPNSKCMAVAGENRKIDVYCLSTFDVINSRSLIKPDSKIASNNSVHGNKSSIYLTPRILVFDSTSTKLAIITRERTIHVYDECGKVRLSVRTGWMDERILNGPAFVGAQFFPGKEGLLCISTRTKLYIISCFSEALKDVRAKSLVKRKQPEVPQPQNENNGDNSKFRGELGSFANKAEGFVVIPANGVRYMEFVENNQLLTLEEPELDVIQSLPPTLWVAKHEGRVFNYQPNLLVR